MTTLPQCLWFTYFPQDKNCVLLASDCSDTLLPCSDCLSGQRQYKEISPTRNKLIISGTATYDLKVGFELIDLSNSSKPNNPLPDYPLSENYSSDSVFMTCDEMAGLVRACGANNRNSNKCFTFDGFKWEENMKSTHDYSYEILALGQLLWQTLLGGCLSMILITWVI
jgi:hypothetical protein